MLLPTFYMVGTILAISENMIDDISLGGAAFRSLLWTVLFGVMMYVEYKHRPRELPRPERLNRWYYSRWFHFVAMVGLFLALIINLVLTVLLIMAFMSV